MREIAFWYWTIRVKKSASWWAIRFTYYFLNSTLFVCSFYYLLYVGLGNKPTNTLSFLSLLFIAFFISLSLFAFRFYVRLFDYKQSVADVRGLMVALQLGLLSKSDFAHFYKQVREQQRRLLEILEDEGAKDDYSKALKVIIKENDSKLRKLDEKVESEIISSGRN